MATSGFVYVIESPSSADLLDGRTEGQALCSALDLARISRWYSLVTNHETFLAALGDRLHQAWQNFGVLPVLHLSMHGNTKGVSFTDGTFLSWADLREALRPLNDAMKGGLLVCMSSCHGLSGCKMAMHDSDDHTFWVIVGPSDAVSWSESAVGFITFYHLFFKGKDVRACVDAMNVCSGAAHAFMLAEGQQIRAGWQSFVERSQSVEMPTAIEQATAESQSHANEVGAAR
jgi:hypothetical protein